jgi:hypothetical protein
MKVGDQVTRMLAGHVPMKLKITELTDDHVVCGAWKFCRKTGAEIDEEMGWGPPPDRTGSYLLEVSAPDQTGDDDGNSPKPAHIEVFTMPSGQNISSVVMDEPEFMEIVDNLGNVFVANWGERIAGEQQQLLRDAKIIPVVSKGEKTKFIFEKFKLDTDLASLIVRGQGKKMVEEINKMQKEMQKFNPENN